VSVVCFAGSRGAALLAPPVAAPARSPLPLSPAVTLCLDWWSAPAADAGCRL